ncbi:MAG: Ig-like domain-containing protein [Mycobacterium sp.]
MPKLGVVRLLAVVMLLSAVTSAMFAAGLSSPAAASPPGWSQGTLIDPEPGQPISISCPTADFCVAADFTGHVLTYNGTSWSSPENIDITPDLESVSCPTADFCASVDGNGHVLTFDGTSWSSPELVDSNHTPTSVSGPSASFCAAVDYEGDALTYNGSSWSSPDMIDAGSHLGSVSCPAANFCAAVDWNGNVLTYNGTSWSSPDKIRDWAMYSVSCPTASFCVAADELGNVLTYNGGSWSSPDSIDPNGDGLTSVSCPTASFCVAVDTLGNVLTYDGSTWSSPSNIDSALAQNFGPCTSAIFYCAAFVSCPSASFCAAVDFIGNAFTYSAPAASKTTLKLSAAKVTYGNEQVEQLAVTVSPQSSDTTPTGTVTVNESSTKLCTLTLSGAKGSCTLSAKKLPAGTYSLVATYGGSTNFAGSTSTKETLTVAKATSKTVLKLSVVKVTYGAEQILHLSITVSPQYSGATPTGKVTVNESSTTLCLITLSSGKGSCTLQPRKLKAGIYSLVATYGGSTNFAGSTSSKETFTVAT